MTVDMNIYNFDEQPRKPAEVNMIFTLQNKYFTNNNNESFEDVFNKETIMFEFKELLNQGSIHKKKPEHFDYFDQDFMDAFEDEVLLYDTVTNKMNKCSSPEGFFFPRLRNI